MPVRPAQTAPLRTMLSGLPRDGPVMRADHRFTAAGVQTSAGRTGARPSRMLVVVAAWGSCFSLLMWGIRDASVLWFAALRALIAGAALLVTVVPAGRAKLLVPRECC